MYDPLKKAAEQKDWIKTATPEEKEAMVKRLAEDFVAAGEAEYGRPQLSAIPLNLWKQKSKGKLCGCLDQMKLPGCCYCFDTSWLHGYDQDQWIEIADGRRDLPFEFSCAAQKAPEVGDIFVWDDRIRVIRQVADHTNQLGNLFALNAVALPLPDPAHGWLVKRLNGDGRMIQEEKKLEEQVTTVLVTDATCPPLFREFRSMVEEGVKQHPNELGHNVICKRADTDFERVLCELWVTFELKFEDGFVCKVVFV